jgi:two-component system, OmpR family, sensor histidine kinase KdpD
MALTRLTHRNTASAVLGSSGMLLLHEMEATRSETVAFALEPSRIGAVLVSKAVIHLTARVCAALALVATVTFVFFHVMPVNATTVGFFYLLAILLIATIGGLVESTISSIAAMLCFNFFFLPPMGTLTISDPQNWIALFTFLATSLTASQLSARAKRRTQEAVDRQNEIERLYSLSRALLLTDAAQPVAKQMVQNISQTFEFPSVALYVRSSEDIHRIGFDELPDIDQKMRDSAFRSEVVRDESSGAVVTPIRLGREPIGSLALYGGLLSDAALHSLLNLVAIGLERASSQKAVNRAEVARQSEELKSTLLDAIAHEFKTPLTSIKAVTTDLLSESTVQLQQQQRELISIVDESTDRLAKLVTDAIQLARIEGGTFRLNQGVYFPNSLISGALRQMKSLMEDRAVEILMPDDLPLVRVDGELIQMVITHLLDNALKYSPPSSAVVIGARLANNKVIVFVRDHGPGIVEEDRARIFEKFYRGKNERHLKGTGMGLAIVEEIIRAHGEDISVTSKPGEGSEFWFSLPIAQESGPA